MKTTAMQLAILAAWTIPSISGAQVASISDMEGPATPRTFDVDISSCLELQDSINQPTSTLVVNRNSIGTNPLFSYMGELDPNLLVVEGEPGAEYLVELLSCGYQPLSADILYQGTLNTSGRAQIVLQPGTLTEGDEFFLQATLQGPDPKSEAILSGATRISVVRTMSANIELAMQPGSVADVRGPVTSVGANTIGVGNLIYNTTAKTEFANVKSLAGLSVGDWVVVDGAFNAQGQFEAFEIGREDFESQVRLAGRVQGIGPAGLAMLNVSVFMSSETTYFDVLTGTWTDYSAIQPGMAIEVRVPVEATFPSCTEVRLNIPVEIENEPEDEPETEIEDPPPPPFCS